MDDQSATISPRRVPALVTYLAPFRIVEKPELTPWNCTIEEINKQAWDYVSLHEIVGGVRVGLPEPYHLVVGRDGALALPPIDSLRSDTAAVEFFNRCLAALLMGGIYCQSITLDNLEFGSIIDWKYLRSHSRGGSASGRFHEQIRMKMASPFEAIELRNPRTVAMDDLENSMAVGLKALGDIPQLGAEFLLKGVTGIARRDWGTALANLWIVVEQLTEHLWDRHVIAPEKAVAKRIAGRKDQLADNRTWTVSARHELLLRMDQISATTLGHLSTARKARNDLSHTGKHPDESVGWAAFDGIRGLLGGILTGPELPMFALPLRDLSLSDPFAPKKREPLEPEFWMDIPKLPGERELENSEAKHGGSVR